MSELQKPKEISKVPPFWVGEEKEHLIENLAMLLTSGMGILQALQGMKDGVKSAWAKRLIDNLEFDVNNGSTLWQALEKYKIFPAQIIYLIKIGERSGRLPENLKVIAAQQEKERIFKGKIRSAMLYPAFVLGLTVIVGLGVMWFILPKLANVFTSLNTKLPLITKIMISLGGYLSKHGLIVIPAIILALAILVYLLFGFSPTKTIGEKILFFIPGTKKLILETEISRLGFVLGTLLNAGLPVTESIDVLSAGGSSKSYKAFYKFLKKSVEDGNSFQKSFARYPQTNRLLPNTVKQIIIAGELSGKLPEALLQVNKTYEAKIDDTTKDLAVMLEPILLVVVWVGVLLIALAVILPIYSLIGGLDQSTGVK